MTTRAEVIARFLDECREAHQANPEGIGRTVRVSDLRKAYRVTLAAADKTLTRDDAYAALAAAYRAEFNPVPCQVAKIIEPN